DLLDRGMLLPPSNTPAARTQTSASNATNGQIRKAVDQKPTELLTRANAQKIHESLWGGGSDEDAPTIENLGQIRPAVKLTPASEFFLTFVVQKWQHLKH